MLDKTAKEATDNLLKKYMDLVQNNDAQNIELLVLEPELYHHLKQSTALHFVPITYESMRAPTFRGFKIEINDELTDGFEFKLKQHQEPKGWLSELRSNSTNR